MPGWFRALCFAGAIIAAASGVASAAADMPLAGPQLGAAQLRAVRGAKPQRELRLVFDLRQGDAAPVTLNVWIGADYIDIVEGGRETLYDFRLRRRLLLDRRAGSFANFSLYGDVAFRRFDMEKRLTLAQMLLRATGGAEPARALKPFWIESDIGVLTGAKPPPEIKKELLGDGGMRFRVDGEEVALFAPTAERLPLKAGQGFARFLRFRLPLHPDIIAALEEDGRVPQRLVFVTVAGDQRGTTGLILRKSETVESDYPLPETLLPQPIQPGAQDPESAGLRALLPVMQEAVAGKWGGGPRLLADYRRAVDLALRRKQGFQAALMLAEMTMQFGRAASDCAASPSEAPCQTAEELSHRLGDDERAAALFKAQGIAAQYPQDALKLWQGLKRDDVSDGYVVDIFVANLLSTLDRRPEAVAAFATGMRGNPYLGALYKDLGDHFLRAARVDLAWLCYDLGRALPHRADIAALSSVDALEQRLAIQYADFF